MWQDHTIVSWQVQALNNNLVLKIFHILEFILQYFLFSFTNICSLKKKIQKFNFLENNNNIISAEVDMVLQQHENYTIL